MYNAIFKSDNGLKYAFGANGETVFDMNIGDGIAVNIGTSQGFSQIGESVDTQSVTGKKIKVSGTVYGDVQSRKVMMRRVFAPFVAGELIFDDKYRIRVYIDESPTFSPVKNDGRFMMSLFAPFPFFSEISEKTSEIGAIEPQFSFPVNYATPHVFGIKSAEKYINIINSGDVRIPFNLHITASGDSTNPIITNMRTLEILKINGTLHAGDRLDIYRTEDNILRAELTSNEDVSDVISWIDESSTLFELAVGDNLISAYDDEDGANMVATINYSPAMAAVYES